MEIVFFWLLVSAVVARAADRRRRSGFGWLVLSIALSPLLAGLLLFALPQRQALRSKDQPEANPQPHPQPARRQTPAFVPDGVYGGIPYKVSDAGAVEVMLSGGRVRFRNMEQFLALAIKQPNAAKHPVEDEIRGCAASNCT